MQWADVSLLEFVEYLLEWSRNHPIYVLTLARPELNESHPSWGAGKRNFTALTLEPLAAEAMEELLDGFVPGLPAELRDQILDRAEGVPLYAVETVRMLLDRGLLEQVGDEYRPTGPIEALQVPETLHALIAARIDALEPEQRRLIQNASVLGKTFAGEALAHFSDRTTAELEPMLAALVRRGPDGAVGPAPRRSAASTRSSRICCAESRTRHSLERAQDTPPRGGELPRGLVGAGRAGDRRGRLVALHGGVPPCSRRGRCRGDPAACPRHARARG